MRTFIPVAAGVGKMKYSYYLRNNLIGALSWGISVPLVGYFLGNVAFIRDHVIVVTLVLIALSFIPVTMEIIKARKY
jgi:membrane-associated protein